MAGMETTEIFEQPIGDNTEGFTPDVYLQTPSWGTISMEYPDQRGEIMEKSNVFHNNTPILNQWNVWACSVFWVVKAENEADFYDEKKILDAMAIRNKWIELWVVPNKGTHWWSMMWALNLMKSEWYISWRYFCNSVEQIRSALERKHLCYTWTNKCSWSQTKKTWWFTKWNIWTGHLFAIIWIDFDKKCLIAANSWGEDWGKMDWLFNISFDDIPNLYSIVAIMDTPKSPEDKNIQIDIEDSKLMKEKKIWNWENPDEALLKIHSVFMIMRAFVDLNIDNDEALDLAQREGIVANLSVSLTRRHFLIMVFRTAYWQTNREEAIPDIMKLLWVIKTTEHLDEPITRYHASLIIARMLRNLWQID